MITTETTSWIVRKLAADAAAATAAQTIIDEQARLEAARDSYTAEDLYALMQLALDEDDYDVSQELAHKYGGELAHRFPADWVHLSGWGVRAPAIRRGCIPAEVRYITRCNCESGTCSYCTCCELWNGEHSCEWDVNHPPEALTLARRVLAEAEAAFDYHRARCTREEWTCGTCDELTDKAWRAEQDALDAL